MRLLVATTNANKVREIRELLAGVPCELITLDAYPGVSAPEETGRTFEENARQKALYYSAATGELRRPRFRPRNRRARRRAWRRVRKVRRRGAHAQKFAMLYDALRAAGRDGENAARFVCAVALARGSASCSKRGGRSKAGSRRNRRRSGFGYDRSSSALRSDAGGSPQAQSVVSHRPARVPQLREFLLSNNRGDRRDRRGDFLCVLSVLCGFSLRRATPAARCASGARDRSARSSARGRRRSRSAIPRRR